jgi:hypothetical protein
MQLRHAHAALAEDSLEPRKRLDHRSHPSLKIVTGRRSTLNIRISSDPGGLGGDPARSPSIQPESRVQAPS